MPVLLEMAKSGRHPAIEIAAKTPRVTVCPAAAGTLEYELGFVVDAAGGLYQSWGRSRH